MTGVASNVHDLIGQILSLAQDDVGWLTLMVVASKYLVSGQKPCCRRDQGGTYRRYQRDGPQREIECAAACSAGSCDKAMTKSKFSSANISAINIYILLRAVSISSD